MGRARVEDSNTAAPLMTSGWQPGDQKYQIRGTKNTNLDCGHVWLLAVIHGQNFSLCKGQLLIRPRSARKARGN